MNITQSELKEHLFYDCETGVFTWLKSYKNQHMGKPVGSTDRDGYLQIKVLKKLYRAHRLAWLFVNGCFPSGQIDHINGMRQDNRITNLREVTFAGNSQNQRIAHKDSTYGLLGVDKLSHRKLFRARISICGKRKTLGYFKTSEEAHAVYLTAKRTMHLTCTI